MRIPRAQPATAAGPAYPERGGPRPLTVRPRQTPAPGSSLAIASLVCGLAGVVLMCPIVFPVGALLGVVALRDLPAGADRTARLQAQWGMWIGILGTVFSVLLIGFFVFLLALGMLGAAAQA